MMKIQKIAYRLSFIATMSLPSLTLFTSPTIAGEVVDPAPSGNEQTIVSPGEKSILVTPGRDSPVKETREGNKIKLHFDQGEIKNSKSVNDIKGENATVIYDSK